MSVQREGGCACRQVRYRLTSEPLFVHCCHCLNCQRQTGSAFVINLLIEADRVELVAGDPQPVEVPRDDGSVQKVYRCPECRGGRLQRIRASRGAVRPQPARSTSRERSNPTSTSSRSRRWAGSRSRSRRRRSRSTTTGISCGLPTASRGSMPSCRRRRSRPQSSSSAARRSARNSSTSMSPRTQRAGIGTGRRVGSVKRSGSTRRTVLPRVWIVQRPAADDVANPIAVRPVGQCEHVAVAVAEDVHRRVVDGAGPTPDVRHDCEAGQPTREGAGDVVRHVLVEARDPP